MLTQNPDATLILVVEDDYNHAELIQRSFETAPEEYRMEFASSLRDARHALELHPPNLILADYRLPDGDGKELVGMANRACPVVLMTAQGSEKLAVEAMKAGAQDYIVKSTETFTSMSRIVGLALREWNLIQDRRKIYEAVSRGKREWEQTFDAVPDLIAIIDANHTVTRVNRAMAERCGLKPSELVGRTCYNVVHGLMHPPAYCPHVRMMQDEQEHSEEMEEKRLNGVFDVSVSPLYDFEGQLAACVHVARDITDRKKAEEERRKLEQQFQQAQKLESLGVLAGGIAHDFNNILTIILGHCFMAMENVDSGLPHKAHVLQIEGAANRAADLCRQMLAYAGKNPLVQTQVNLWLLLDEMVKMLTSAIKKNVTIELDLTRDVPKIAGDNSQIQQIVMNLIINAAEAIGDNNGTIRVALTKTTVDAGQANTDFLGNTILVGRYACLEVSDTGCGMDNETQKRIFEPFYTTKFTGRGLGMSAILGIIKAHNGALQLSSEPGVGTTFKVYFPLFAVPDAAETRSATGSAPSAKGSGTILLVDDEEALRTIGSALLESMGFSAMTAANGREALDIYRERGSGIDLILMDLIMPEMGGIETYHELRKVAPTVPIVISSGYSVGEVSELMNDEYAGVIQKPYRPDRLQEVLMKLLRTAR